MYELERYTSSQCPRFSSHYFLNATQQLSRPGTIFLPGAFCQQPRKYGTSWPSTATSKPQTKTSLLFFKLFFLNICAQQCKYLTPAPQFDVTFWDLVLNISFKINPQNSAAYGIQTCSFSQPMRIRSPVFCLEKVIRNLDFCFPLTHNLPIDFHPISIRWMFASKMKSVLYGRD